MSLQVLDGDGVIVYNNLADINPAGSGTTVEWTFSGLSYTGSTIRLVLPDSRSDVWTMVSEVSFGDSPVPEPSALGGLFGLGALLVASRRA